MKKGFVILLILACNEADQKHKNIENDIRIFMTQTYKELDSTMIVDTIRLISLDTITEFERLMMKANHLYGEKDKIYDQIEAQGKITDLDIKSLKLYSYLSSPTLTDISKKDVQDGIEKSRELFKKDSLLQIEIDSLVSKSKNADSVNLVDYEAKFLYQLRRKDQSVKKDTGYVFLNKELNIIRKEDYYKSIN